MPAKTQKYVGAPAAGSVVRLADGRKGIVKNVTVIVEPLDGDATVNVAHTQVWMADGSMPRMLFLNPLPRPHSR